MIKERKYQKTIALTNSEYALLAESRELFRLLTGVKMSWGAYVCALSFGALAAKTMTGLLIRCPECGSEVNMIMTNPKIKPARKSSPRQHPPQSEGQTAGQRSQTPAGAS